MSTHVKQLHLYTVLIFVITAVSGVTAFAQTECQSKLAEAKNLTRTGKHNDALALINSCLNQRESGDLERAEAYKLLGIVNVALNDHIKAKAAFLEMLQLQPLASIDSQESPEVFKVFEETRVDFFSANDTQNGTKNWPWIAVAGAVLATVGALLFLK